MFGQSRPQQVPSGRPNSRGRDRGSPGITGTAKQRVQRRGSTGGGGAPGRRMEDGQTDPSARPQSVMSRRGGDRLPAASRREDQSPPGLAIGTSSLEAGSTGWQAGDSAIAGAGGTPTRTVVRPLLPRSGAAPNTPVPRLTVSGSTLNLLASPDIATPVGAREVV